jgi:pimeloyl-ACP methyl ester carboxylesterase
MVSMIHRYVRRQELIPMGVEVNMRHSTQLDGVTTTYLDVGQGETIVALHGIPTSSLLFAPLVPPLRHYRLIAPDLLGQGRTETPSTGNLDYAAYAEHLRAFMHAVPPDHVHLLIHDLGGILGLEWATEHVERVKSVTILSTTLTGSFRVGRALYAANLIVGQSFLRWGMRFTLKRARLEAALLEEWVQPWSRRRILRGIDHFASRHLQRIRSKVEQLRVPVLVIWGKQDTIFPLSHAARLVRLLPNARLCTIERCGHWSPLDAPEELAQCMTEFFHANGHA